MDGEDAKGRVKGSAARKNIVKGTLTTEILKHKVVKFNRSDFKQLITILLNFVIVAL